MVGCRHTPSPSAWLEKPSQFSSFPREANPAKKRDGCSSEHDEGHHSSNNLPFLHLSHKIPSTVEGLKAAYDSEKGFTGLKPRFSNRYAFTIMDGKLE